ncbi:GNAT family acetyltransferase [Legionella wadsworthii]|uniref:GNAT family acetyltransferase n=1 Tax=Legionella wadsworthii TaxID=28088 RepID=A0A378LRG9_9GAMM|nr:GNAT family N-acetyltransferase [Legionella wadsworthii]STY29545.1 GNAT family acetyltransferase [Legionella wadsworthii]
MSKYHIEQMTQEEVTIAVEWARKEGWNPGLNDASCFYQTDPNGFFAGKLNDRIIAVGSAVIYDDSFAFCGLYMVDRKYRGQGYGIELTHARLAYVGDRNAGIDGVLNMIDTYAQIGYQFAHNNARYALDHSPIDAPKYNSHLMQLKATPKEQLIQYDRRYFPASREQFLCRWINQDTAFGLGYVQENQLKGYGVIRKCFEGYKIGPLFADNAFIAESLFQHLIQYAKNDIVYLDIPENNPSAVELVKKYNMDKVFATARMYLKGPPDIAIEGIYGMTTFELG